MNMKRKLVQLAAVMLWTSGASAQAVSSISGVAQTAAARAAASGLAAKVSVDLSNVKLEQALRTIGKQAGLRITLSRDVIALNRKVTLDVNGVTAENAFHSVLKGTGVTMSAGQDGQVVFTKESQGSAKGQGVVSGKVTDGRTGKPLSGVGVTTGSDSRGVVTGEDGSYRLANIATGTTTITVRMVGYAKQTRTASVGEGATVTMDFKLEPSANVLDQVVVTGTVIASELKSVPNAITVVTAKQIEERGITRIDQLFRGDIPGLFALNQGSVAPLDEVFMFSRGATALRDESVGGSVGVVNKTNPIKTYVDGIEMADSKYLSQIDPQSIERIEIITGPQASTIYGANAINGVMQIFTKRGTGNKPKVSLGLTSGVTQNNFSSRVAPNHLIDANASGAEGRISYSLGSSWNYLGAWTPGKRTQRLSFFGSGRTEVNKLTIDLSARQGITRNRQNGDVQQPIVAARSTGVYLPTAAAGLPVPKNQSVNGRTYGFKIGYRPLSWWSNEVVVGSDVSANEAYKTARGFSLPSDTTVAVETNNIVSRASQSFSSTMQLPLSSVAEIAKLSLTLGADHWRTTGANWTASGLTLTGTLTNPSVTRNHPSKNSGAYVQGQFGLWDAVFLTYGVRADWNPNFGNDARVHPGKYGISLVEDIGSVSVKLRGTYGRSIRPPAAGIEEELTLAEAGFQTVVLNQFGPTTAYILGNPDLVPEDQRGGEGGLELYFGNRVSLVVTRYNQTVDNLIQWVFDVDSARSLNPVAPNTNECSSRDGFNYFDSDGHCFKYQSQWLNIGSIRNQGWETQGNVNVGPLAVRGTYTWMKSRILGITPRYRRLVTDAETGRAYEPGRPFNYFPEHTWAMGLTYSQSKSTMAIAINGIGKRYVGSTDLTTASSAFNRFSINRPRMQSLDQIYRPLGPGYATADFNGTHRFTSNMDALLQITNLTNYYQNDFAAAYASAGRQTRAGVRIRM